MTRERLLAQLADLVPESRPVRIAIDGPDAAGKTTLADELAALLGAERAMLDDYLRPTAARYRRGRDSPDGYYRDSFELEAFRRTVLVSPAPILIVDGVFLLRPELDDLWTVRVFVECAREEILRRAADRDGLAASLYETRYLPAQERYRREQRPDLRADAVIDNTNPAYPLWV